MRISDWSSDVCSSDLGSVFDGLPGWAQDEVPGTRGIWAPDISYSDGRYHLYYSLSTFGKNRSAIALVTTPTLDKADPAFGWRDEGVVFRSTPEDDYTAIDANHIVHAEGRALLALDRMSVGEGKRWCVRGKRGGGRGF